jgi:membrane-associated phospholipid phosphatase
VVASGLVVPPRSLTVEPTHLERRLFFGIKSLAVQDWLVLAFTFALGVAALLAPPGPVRDHCIVRVCPLFLVCIFSLVAVRGRLIPGVFLPALVYRLGVYATVQISYFFFREFLPLVNPQSLDAELHGLGLQLFGVEPALRLDAWVSPSTSEWFSFFYFGYFFVLATHVLPMIFLAKDKRLLGEFTFGLLFVFVVGHTTYMLVPGYGPLRAIAGEFQHRLPQGLWLNVVMDTVAEGGALKDIFPSLHTAAPTFIALFSFRNRAVAPYRYTWALVLFFCVNIIVATMFLRWHWIVDVVAGLALAITAQTLGVVVTRFELQRRSRQGLEPTWPLFWRTGA